MFFILLTVGSAAVLFVSSSFWGDPPTERRVLVATAVATAIGVLLIALAASTVEPGPWVYYQGLVLLALAAFTALRGKRAVDQLGE
jgi:uncharacterized membrane protein